MCTNFEGTKYREMAVLALWFFDRDARTAVVICNSGEKLLCLEASISEERKRERKRGVGGTLSQLLKA
jgi:hypothetical protein